MAAAPFDRSLLAAELHYFRVPRAQWPLALARLRQLGANTVATCVPWCWHAPDPAVCDLTGETDPQRDVVGFVLLCARLGFRVILQPGPFVDAGLLGGGVPPWLLHRHPEIHALRADGQPFLHGASRLPRASYAHPLYLEHAQRWIARFSEQLAPLQAPGGPVIAVQVDNGTPADAGSDPRFRCDYNPHVRHTRWPQWLVARYSTVAALNDAWGERFASFDAVPLPSRWNTPTSVEALRCYVDLDTFTDQLFSDALATGAGWLRGGGWRVPLFHTLLAAPWEGGGLLASAPGYTAACGWLAHNVYTEVAAPFGGEGEYRHAFEEYVYFAHWRTRLVRALSPGLPAFIAASSASQDFAFAAPFVGGLDGLCVYAAQQSPREPAIGAWPVWAMEAPIRADGSVRPRLWNARAPLALLSACAGWPPSPPPADLALAFSHAPQHVAVWLREAAPDNRNFAASGSLPGLQALTDGSDQAALGQRIAQELVRAGVDFDVLDLDTATPEALARYRLVVAPAPPLLPRSTQQKLVGIDHLALVGDAVLAFDERLAPCDLLLPEAVLRLPEGVDGATLGALVEELGGVARYAWADAADVDALVRHGAAPGAAYLCVVNRRATAYSGTVAYRDAAGGIEHVQIALGPWRVALLTLLDGEVLGACAGGDAAEGGWRARGLRGGISWSGGAGVVAPYPADDAPAESPPAALLLSAPAGGRFDLRRREGWGGLRVFRLLLDGQLDEAPFAEEGTHLVVPYVADDERGPTDAYLVAAPDAPLPTRLHKHLATLLRARACLLEDAAAHAPANAATQIRATAATLEVRAASPAAPLAYRAALDEALAQLAPPTRTLDAQFTALRAARAAGLPVDAQQQGALEATLEALVLARIGGELGSPT